MRFYTKIVAGILSIAFGLQANAQKSSEPYERPKLVVGIVVDQMRYDYLTRYWDRFGEGGFKRLVQNGFLAKNHHFNYVPTSTAPGHASVYTGATPSRHGILGNDWYDVASGEVVYCVEDATYVTIGSSGNAGKMSPHRLESTTLSDEMRMATNYRGKTIAVAIKDRGAVLPAGHSGTAYWFEGGKDGNWITSSFYMDDLPQWVKQFNKEDAAEVYKKVWNTLYPIETYTSSTEDDVPWERPFDGEKAPVFPHNLPKLWKNNGYFNIIKNTPYGNSLTTDFALAALKAEQLGKDSHVDMLAISYSSPDYIGHQFGVRAIETEDNYLRLDQDIARLLSVLDEEVGVNEYVVFLTADHGAADTPGFLSDHHIPSGFLEGMQFEEGVRAHLEETLGSGDLLRKSHGSQLYYDKRVMDSLEVEAEDLDEVLIPYLRSLPLVEAAFTAQQLESGTFSKGLGKLMQNGYRFGKSGDIYLAFSKGFRGSGYKKGGTSHGTAHIYDTHVPLIMFGKGIVPGDTHELTEIPDIAVTLASLLGTAMPNGANGKVITKAIE